MKKDANKTVLVGLIISLIAFVYLTISFAVKSFQPWAIYFYGFEISALLVLCLCLIELPFAIVGTVSLLRPSAVYKPETAVVSAIFDGVFGLIFFAGILLLRFMIPVSFFDWILTLALLCACVFLIVGASQKRKEQSYL